MKKNHWKRSLSATAVAIAAMGLSLVATTPASAAPSNCPVGATCFWGNADYKTTSYGCSGGGDWVGFYYYISNFTTYYFCIMPSGNYHKANDSVKSIYNRGTQCNSALYKDAGYGGYKVVTTRGTGWHDLVASGRPTDLSSGQFICG